LRSSGTASAAAPPAELSGSSVLPQVRAAGYGERDPVDLGIAAPDQTGPAVDAVRRGGLRPADPHRAQLTGPDLAAQRDARVAAHVERTERVTHDAPPGFVTLRRGHIAGADQDRHIPIVLSRPDWLMAITTPPGDPLHRRQRRHGARI
jgi:hypothetical protein